MTSGSRPSQVESILEISDRYTPHVCLRRRQRFAGTCQFGPLRSKIFEGVELHEVVFRVWVVTGLVIAGLRELRRKRGECDHRGRDYTTSYEKGTSVRSRFGLECL